MKKATSILFRLIVFPFVSLVIIIAGIRDVIYNIGLFLLYGGELINYKSNNEKKTILDCYQLLKSMQDGNVAVFKFSDIPDLVNKLKTK